MCNFLDAAGKLNARESSPLLLLLPPSPYSFPSRLFLPCLSVASLLTRLGFLVFPSATRILVVFLSSRGKNPVSLLPQRLFAFLLSSVRADSLPPSVLVNEHSRSLDLDEEIFFLFFSIFDRRRIRESKRETEKDHVRCRRIPRSPPDSSTIGAEAHACTRSPPGTLFFLRSPPLAR